MSDYSLIGPSKALQPLEPGDWSLPRTHFSFSQFRSYRTCGACYEAEYVLKQPRVLKSALVTGSAVHRALDLGRTALLLGTEIPALADLKDAAGDAFENSLKGIDRQGNKPDVPPVLKLGAYDKSWGQVKDKSVEFAAWSVPQVLAAEAEYGMLAVEAQVDMRGVFDFPFTAYADRLLNDPTWETFGHLGDDKTSGKDVPPDAWAAWQLSSYALPWWMAGEPIGLGINQHVKTATPKLHLWTEDGYSFRPTDAQMVNLLAMIRRAVERISAGIFEPGPSVFGCEYPHESYPAFGIVVPELVAS